VRAFRRAGGVVRQGKGSHVVIEMPDGQVFPIPGKIKVGLLAGIIRQSGLTVEEFLANL
jgi:predicted RNA binding protein YcfA (HicA-like mRNA interferase family)